MPYPKCCDVSIKLVALPKHTESEIKPEIGGGLTLMLSETVSVQPY